jgi:hypothetical protein
MKLNPLAVPLSVRMVRIYLSLSTCTSGWTPAPATVPLNPPATSLFVCIGADLPVYDYLSPCLDPCSCYCPPESSCYTPVCLYRSGPACV